MSDFAEMMKAEGTRRLGERPQQAPRRQFQPRPPMPVPPPMHEVPRLVGAAAPAPQPVQPAPTPRAVGPAWSVGADGLAILERAMRGISRDGALARPNGQIVMLVRRDGMLVDAGDPAGVVTPEDLLALADRISCEMIVVSWNGRKAVFHPLSGAAVLTEDPKGS